MKQINSILRTLCLVALLCMTSVSASAYKTVDDNSFDFYETKEYMGNDRILVIGKDIETKSFCPGLLYEYAFIIMPGVTMTITQDFYNFSKIYVFGTLKLQIDGEVGKNNYGTIYIVTGGTIISETGGTTISGGGDIKNRQQGKIEIVSPETILTKAKLPGQAPTPTANGWKDYWAKGIESTAHDDFYPMYYYSDEACTEVISDLEAWKTNEGKIDKLGPFTIGSTTGDVDEGYCYHGDITFNDNDFYQSDYDFTVDGSITYNRTFTNTNWQALYVPFAMSYSEWKDNFDVAAINNFHEYTDADGKTIKTELEVRLVKSGTLKPNHPYLIRAKNADEYSPQMIFLSTKKIGKSDENSIVCSSVERKYTFTGTYQEMTGLKTKGYIFMSGGKLCKAENDDIALLPQRWYLKIESLGSQVDDESGSAYAKAMQFDIKLLDDEPTGIDEITVTRTPLRNSVEAIYNLNGMRVNGNYKGIVIKNGKKVYQR